MYSTFFSYFQLHFGDQRNVHFELVFVGSTKSGPDPGKWTAEVHCKQVEKDFPHFWRMTRGGNASPVEVRNFQNVDVAVWVRRTLPDGDVLHSQYLKYMDSNIDSKCPIHHFPLVSCPLGSGNKCVSSAKGNARCGKAAAFECPFCSCTTYLCKSCVGITLPPIVTNASLPVDSDGLTEALDDSTDSSFYLTMDLSSNMDV